MASPQRADNDVDRIRELRAEFLLPPASQNPQNQRRKQNSARECNQESMQHIAFEGRHADEDSDDPDSDENDQLAEADGEPGLQEQLVELDERQPEVAAAGKAAFTA